MTPRIVTWGGNEDSISPVESSAGVTPASTSRAHLTGPEARPATFLGLGSGESETPTASGTLGQSEDSFIRHSRYFFKDGNVTFLINGFLYCVHRYLFSRESVYFSTGFARLGARDHEALSTIVSLGNVECEDFEALLFVLYPESFEEREISYEQWRSVLLLSTRWGFTSLRGLALRSIKPPTPCDQLLLARTYAVDHWIVPALSALCERTAPLSLDEVRRMNDEDVVLVAAVREDIRIQIGVSAAEISRRVGTMRARILVSAEGNDVSLTGSTGGVPRPDGWSVDGAGAARAQLNASDLSQFEEIDKTAPMTSTPTSVSDCKKADPKSRDPPMSGAASNSRVSLMLQSTSTGNILRDLPSALAIARYIEDINCITYPEGIKSPKVELNVNAQHGKFLYDRDFLLQFMNVCKEKPDFITPPDVLGLEPRDTSYSMSQGGSGHSPTSNTMSIPGDVGSASIGLGILPGSVGKSADSGFQMGQFSTSAGKMSSEERFLAASARRSASVSGGPPMEPVTPLEVATNRWVATSAHDYDSGLDSEPPKVVERKVKALLNKLTVEHFDSISDQIIACANESKDGRALLQVTKLVFEKATDEATASEMCARLCRKMVEQISPKVQDDGIKNSEGKPFAGGNLFRKYLLNRCQEDFERGWIAKETTAAAAATKATADQAAKEAKEKTKGDEESELYSDEYYAAAMAQRRGLGLIRFIGELFKLQMLTERIMHECIKKLFGNAENPGEEEIESLCKLLITVGSLLDTPKARAHVDVYFSRMRALTKNKNVNARMVFMLQEVIELRKHKWIPREAVAAPTTIAQVHEVAAKEKLAQEKDPFMRQNASTSRGGSRRASGSRDVADAPHPDGLSVADTGAACVQSKAGTVDPPTPTSSRPPGHKHGVDLGVGGSPEPSPQQRKLKLLPRTKSKRKKSKKSAPTVSEVGPDDEAAGEGGTSAPNTISEGEAKLKIDEDVKEFFSIRMFHEAESYFSGLPTEHRHRLVDALVMKSVEMKDSDVELVGDLFVRVREKDLCSPAAFEEGFNGLAELLDDLAVDIPKAWSYFAILLKGSGLDQDEERYARIAEKTLDPDRLNQVM